MAGVFNNFLLAIVLLFVIALIWGAPSLKPVINGVEEGYPVAEAGIVAGDVITEVNGSKVKTWDKAQLLLLLKAKDDTYNITVRHENGEYDTYEVQPKVTKDEDGVESRAFGIQIKSEVSRGFVPALKYGFQKFGSLIEQMWLTLGSLFNGGLSINNLSGPVGIYTVVGETRKSGVSNVLFLIAYLSINLGIMNILPIPALDGGHVLFLLIEMITRKKVNQKVESITTTIFFVLLLLLMLYITIHDVITLIL